MRHHWNNRPGGPDSLAHQRHQSPYGMRNRLDGFAHRGSNGFRRHNRFAQHPRAYAFRSRRFHRGHRAFINYSPEQRKQVVEINKEYRQKREDLYKQDNITLKQYKTGLAALEKDKRAKIQALVTPEQKAALDERRKQRDENAQVMAAARLERLRLNLNLSDDQVARLKAGQQELRNKARTIHENDNLLPQEKRQQMRTLMTTRNNSFKSILTPGQYMKFQQMGHRRFGGPWQSQGHGNYSGRTT
jgi:Spy/CpxP family protein refolding chaperone